MTTLIVLPPGVQVKPVEGHSLRPQANLRDVGSNFRIEAVTVHAKVARGIAQPQHTGQKGVVFAVHAILRPCLDYAKRKPRRYRALANLPRTRTDRQALHPPR